MPNKTPAWTVYLIALILSACSLIYELLIAQSMAMLAANTVVWYSLTVGIYLAAMGLGALLYNRWLQGSRWRGLFQVEIALSVVGALAVPLVHLAHAVHLFLYINDLDISSAVLFFAVCFVIIFVVGLLTGLELPLLIQLGNDLSPERRTTNRVLEFDYLGALAGGLLFPLVLLPSQELVTIGLVTANVNLCVAAFVLYRSSPAAPHPARGSRRREPIDRLAPRATVCAALTVILLIGYVNLGSLQQYFLKKYYYYPAAADSLGYLLSPMSDMPDVFRASSPYQKIDIVHDPGGDELLVDAYSTKYIEDPSQQSAARESARAAPPGPPSRGCRRDGVPRSTRPCGRSARRPAPAPPRRAPPPRASSPGGPRSGSAPPWRRAPDRRSPRGGRCRPDPAGDPSCAS